MMMNRISLFRPLLLLFVLLLMLGSCTVSTGEGAGTTAPESESGSPAGDPKETEGTTEEGTTEAESVLETTPPEPPLSCLAYVRNEENRADFSAISAAWREVNTKPALSEEELALPTKDLIDRIFTLENVYIFRYVSNYSPSFLVSSNQDFCAPSCDIKLSRICFYNTYRDHMSGFNGFVELEKRPDAAHRLLEKYKTSLTDDSFGVLQKNYGRDEYGSISLTTQCLEVVLSQQFYFDQLTEDEVAELYATLERFYVPEADRERLPRMYQDQSFRFYKHYVRRNFPSAYGEVDPRDDGPIRLCWINGDTVYYAGSGENGPDMYRDDDFYQIHQASDGTYRYSEYNRHEDEDESMFNYRLRFTEESYGVFYCPDDPEAPEYTFVLGDFRPVLVPYEG